MSEEVPHQQFLEFFFLHSETLTVGHCLLMKSQTVGSI